MAQELVGEGRPEGVVVVGVVVGVAPVDDRVEDRVLVRLFRRAVHVDDDDLVAQRDADEVGPVLVVHVDDHLRAVLLHGDEVEHGALVELGAHRELVAVVEVGPVRVDVADPVNMGILDVVPKVLRVVVGVADDRGRVRAVARERRREADRVRLVEAAEVAPEGRKGEEGVLGRRDEHGRGVDVAVEVLDVVHEVVVALLVLELQNAVVLVVVGEPHDLHGEDVRVVAAAELGHGLVGPAVVRVAGAVRGAVARRVRGRLRRHRRRLVRRRRVGRVVGRLVARQRRAAAAAPPSRRRRRHPHPPRAGRRPCPVRC